MDGSPKMTVSYCLWQMFVGNRERERERERERKKERERLMILRMALHSRFLLLMHPGDFGVALECFTALIVNNFKTMVFLRHVCLERL